MEKILTFVVGSDAKLLALLGSDKDPQFHESFWYVVTGSMEKQDKCIENTVKRELKEETNLDAKYIKNLSLTYKYDSLGKHCIEHVFLTYVDNKDVILNEESIDYKWCDLDEFINLIKWYNDKSELKKLLQTNI